MIEDTKALYTAVKDGWHIRLTNPMCEDLSNTNALVKTLDDIPLEVYLVVCEGKGDGAHYHIVVPKHPALDKKKIRGILGGLGFLDPWTRTDPKPGQSRVVRGNGITSITQIRNEVSIAKYVGKCEKVYYKGLNEEFYRKLLKGSYQKSREDMAVRLSDLENRYYTDEILFKDLAIEYLRLKLEYNHTLRDVKQYLQKVYLRKHSDNDQKLLDYLRQNDIITMDHSGIGLDDYKPFTNEDRRILSM